MPSLHRKQKSKINVEAAGVLLLMAVDGRLVSGVLLSQPHARPLGYSWALRVEGWLCLCALRASPLLSSRPLLALLLSLLSSLFSALFSSVLLSSPLF